MKFDVADHINAVRRSVSSLEHDGKPARSVSLSRSYEATVSDLWGAVTSRDRIPRWFLPVVASSEAWAQAAIAAGTEPGRRSRSRKAHDGLLYRRVRIGGAEEGVELRGFEPLTPCVQSRCSPN